MMDQTRGDHELSSNAVHVRIYLWNDRSWREAAVRKLPIKCPATDYKYCSPTKFSSNGLGIGLATDPR
jgi:hypothetical protein